jgi:hypothetical protein
MPIAIQTIFCVALVALIAIVLFLLIRKPLLGAIVLVVLLCAFTAAISSWIPPYKTHLHLFANHIKEVIDPHELQKWAVSTLAKSNSNSSEIPLKEIPEPIRILRNDGSPLQMAFSQLTTSPKDSCVMLAWGGGLGHWGIDIGAPSFEQPHNDTCVYIKWIPGVYFWEQNR